ncbi:hypothetical protein [Leekyejoonella antrihumi]|uniref:DUF8017 domain-containing protein n=1 Tax=Leekyejoonella antrihumi TaxID=1660198 RepID=A0A563DX86_9MICO|nr:hypothetical protein [Leekyejoonella antrihumi]TWP34739.1 hypothetical protein FGL98_16680 [Leekyejoonella antrihumi]
MLAALIAVVVVVAVVVTVVILKVTGGHGRQAANAAGSNPAATSTPSTPEDSWTNPDVVRTGVRPLKAGWQAVLAEKRLASAAYDVPKKNWVYKSTEIIGFADSTGKPLAAAGDAATYRAGFCKTSKTADLAFVGFYGIGQSDPADAAPDAAKKFANAIALRKDNKSYAHRGKMTTSQTGVQGLPAVESTIVATTGDRDKKNCDSAKVEVRTMGVSMGSRSTLLVLVRAIDVPDALSANRPTRSCGLCAPQRTD